MGVNICGVETLVAEVALEAGLVPLEATGEEFLSGVDWLVAFKANVRHFEKLFLQEREKRKQKLRILKLNKGSGNWDEKIQNK